MATLFKAHHLLIIMLHTKTKNPMSLLANYLQYDAAIIGNHEFNYGMDILNNAVTTANFPYLSANILDKNSKNLISGNHM